MSKALPSFIRFLDPEVHTLLMVFAHEYLDAQRPRVITCWKRLDAEIARRNAQRREPSDPALKTPSVETMRRAIECLGGFDAHHDHNGSGAREATQ